MRYLGTFVVGPVLLTLGLAITVLYTAVGAARAGTAELLAGHPRHASAFIASALFTLGFSTSVLQLVQHRRGARPARGRAAAAGSWTRCPRGRRSSGRAYRLHVVAFPLWTFTVIAGAIWAEHAWGRYWNWDPKEVWSFVIWVVYAGYLHARSTRGWDGRAGGVVRDRRLRVRALQLPRGQHLLRRLPLVLRRLTGRGRATDQRRAYAGVPLWSSPSLSPWAPSGGSAGGVEPPDARRASCRARRARDDGTTRGPTAPPALVLRQPATPLQLQAAQELGVVVGCERSRGRRQRLLGSAAHRQVQHGAGEREQQDHEQPQGLGQEPQFGPVAASAVDERVDRDPENDEDHYHAEHPPTVVPDPATQRPGHLTR